MVNRIIFSFLLLVLPFFVNAKTAAEELQEMLSGITSMRADFVEQIAAQSDRELKVEMREKAEVRPQATGEMLLVRPGKFRWQVKDPENRLIVTDGKYLWIYDADLAQATKKKLDFKSLGTPALLLSGSIADIEKTFSVKKLHGSSEHDIWFELTPKLDVDAYQWIELYFKKGKLVAMQIADNLGQRNLITFSKAKINLNIAPSMFQFKVPKDVDVIEE